jgi:BASS family bile acid:Na+ symporter
LLNEDVALIAAIVGFMAVGILLPAAGKLIEPYTLLWLGALLFLNLLRLNLSDLVAVFKTPRQLVVLSIIKLGGTASLNVCSRIYYLRAFRFTNSAPF